MPRKAETAELSTFQQKLIGTWTNQSLPGTNKGDKDDPYSYTVMPLPQQSPQQGANLGYVLKNFTYFETIVFNGPDAVTAPAAAPNRGGGYQQIPFVLFYDQQIRLAEGPDIGAIVHEENGAWLHLTTGKQQVGPYLYPPTNPVFEPGHPIPQSPERTMCKQISVPHGVSVLALGSFEECTGEPKIPVAPSVLPTPDDIDTSPYGAVLNTPDNYQNPRPELTQQINLPLQNAIEDLAAAGHAVSNYIYCRVESTNGGTVVNIPFEQRKAALAGYNAEYWLLSFDGGQNYDILAYTQRILLDIVVGENRYTFPHPTSNVLTRSTV
ncbi:heme-binding protein [Actinophytocola sp.]|uniref:heme-binding protein n=1 Tax=Actinophytocola sp. TaxID=1872138 RepID=UPI002ED58B3E